MKMVTEMEKKSDWQHDRLEFLYWKSDALCVTLSAQPASRFS